MAYRIVAERSNETVRMDRSSMLMAVAKARVWASEGWKVTIIVADGQAYAFATDGEARLIATMTGTMMTVVGRDGIDG